MGSAGAAMGCVRRPSWDMACQLHTELPLTTPERGPYQRLLVRGTQSDVGGT